VLQLIFENGCNLVLKKKTKQTERKKRTHLNHAVQILSLNLARYLSLSFEHLYNTPGLLHNIMEDTRGGIKIFKALTRLASNSKFLLAKSEKNSPKSCLC
jgi:hypothetical protein